jgi:hypothetical protein
MKRSEIAEGMRVEAGDGDEYDTGIVHSIQGKSAVVGWDSGATCLVPIADLRLSGESLNHSQALCRC